MATYANGRAQFPRSRSVWRIGFCAEPNAGKVAGWASARRSRLASLLFFPYALPVKRLLRRAFGILRQRDFPTKYLLLCFAVLACSSAALLANPRQTDKEVGPAVTKVEPPSWWVGLTPEVMLLLSGHDLDATHVACNFAGAPRFAHAVYGRREVSFHLAEGLRLGPQSGTAPSAELQRQRE